MLTSLLEKLSNSITPFIGEVPTTLEKPFSIAFSIIALFTTSNKRSLKDYVCYNSDPLIPRFDQTQEIFLKTEI